MIRRALVPLTILILLAVPATATARPARKPHECVVPRLEHLSNPVARRRTLHAGCRYRFRLPHKRGGKLTVARQFPRPGRKLRHGTLVTVWLAAHKPVVRRPPATTSTVLPATPTAAHLDPTFTQSVTNPLQVTWTYSATDAGTTVSPPLGTLTLLVTQSGQAAGAGECAMNVGGTNPDGGTCTLTLPSYGQWSVTVTYTGSDSTIAAPSTMTVTDTIEPPAVTLPATWQSVLTGSVIQIGTQATITVTASNWQDATSVTLGAAGATCNVAVTGPTVSCTVTMIDQTVSSVTVGYPGATTTGTQTVPPNGVQQVTYDWQPVIVTLPSSDVTILDQIATVNWQFWEAGSQESNIAPTGTLTTPLYDTVTLSLYATGNDLADPNPKGGIDFQVISHPAGAIWTATNNAPVGSSCAYSSAANGQADGSCLFGFETPGTYVVQITYVSADPNYPSTTSGPTVTIDVTS